MKDRNDLTLHVYVTKTKITQNDTLLQLLFTEGSRLYAHVSYSEF